MKKVLSIFMAILMVVTMFSFSTVAFAEEGEAEKTEKIVFIGTGTNYGYKLERVPGSRVPALVVADSSSASPWNFNVFNPETPLTGLSHPQVEIPETVGTAVIDKVNGYAASGEYSRVLIKATAGATDETVKITGLKGTADCPIVIASEKAYDAIPQLVTFENSKTADPSIILDGCEYVTVEFINVKALNKGIAVENCADVTIKNVSFTNIGYVDYLTPSVLKDAEGKDVIDENGAPVEVFADMDTTSILEKGPSVYVGVNCDGVAIEACSFTKCRAGVVVDCTALAEGEEESTGVEVVDCTFEEMTDAAVYVDGADDVVVSGGSAKNSGTLANAADYDNRAAATFVVANAENITIEKVYSTDNNSFINAKAVTGRVRYNVSDRDGASVVDAAELLVYNNTFVSATSLDLTAKVRNNIFSMLIGEKVAVSDGDNNCYYWTSKGDRGSIRKNPRFANAFDGSVEGTSVRDNYILATGSPCIGKGEKVEDDMGATDFYGNAIGESYNIGAYAGEGAEATVEIVSDFVDFFNYIFAVISNFFANLFA